MATQAKLTDSELLRRVARRDEGAFTELYQRYSRPIYTYLVRLVVDQGVADDLLQEVFLAVWRNADRFRRQAQVKTWIYRIAHNMGVSWLRSKRVDQVELSATHHDAGVDLEQHLAVKGWQDEVLDAIASLPHEQREVVELAFYHQLSYREIAAIVRCPVGTIKSRMSHARKNLGGVLLRRDLAGGPLAAPVESK